MVVLSIPFTRNNSDSASAMTTTFEFALEHQDKGYNVIPCWPRSKKPKIKWKIYQQQRVTREELKRWFLDEPQNNMAVVCGKISNLTVVDCDSQEAIDHYFMTCDPSGTVVDTSRGLHFHHEYREGKNISKNGIDVKNDGSLSMLPGSIHPTGTDYIYDSEEQRTPYNPDWFRTTRTQIKYTMLRIETETAQEALKRCRAYIAKVEPAISGQGGHIKCFYVACKIRDFLREHMDWNQALPVLREYNQRAEPPFSERELEHKLSDAWRLR